MATPPPVPKAPENNFWTNLAWPLVSLNITIALVLEIMSEGIAIQSLIGCAITGALMALYQQNERLHGQK